MSAITCVLHTDPDGSLHLPLPAALPKGRYRVTATIEPVDARSPVPAERRQSILAALERLAQSDPFRAIADPVTWQREVRADRDLAH